MKHISACDLERAIKKEYGRKFEVLGYMEDQRKITATVSKLYDDQKPLIESFKKGEKIGPFEELNTLQALLAGLYDAGKLEDEDGSTIKREGEVLICFDD